MKAVNPIISTLFLLIITIGIIIVVWMSVQDMAKKQAIVIESSYKETLNCKYAQLKVFNCAYNNNELDFNLINSGGINFSGFKIMVLDSANYVAEYDLNEGIDFNSSYDFNSTKHTTKFQALLEPINLIKVIPKECPNKAAEINSCD